MSKFDSPPIYLLQGMTPQPRVFDRLLPLLSNAHVVDWIEPSPAESVSQRLGSNIPNGTCYIAGLSFGGIVALELSRVIKPLGCILISSIRSPHELPPGFRLARVLSRSRCESVLSSVGTIGGYFPKRFRTRSTTRMTKLAGSSGAWHRWATAAVLDWQPEDNEMTCPVLQIHGDCDVTFPVSYFSADVVIPGGRHTLPLSYPRQVAEAVLEFCSREPTIQSKNGSAGTNRSLR